MGRKERSHYFGVESIIICVPFLQAVGQALIATLQGGLGELFTSEVKEAYITFYGIVTKNMKDGLNEAYALAKDD